MKKITLLMMLLIGFNACKKTETVVPDYTTNFIGTFSQNTVSNVTGNATIKSSYKFIFTRKDNNTLLANFIFNSTERFNGVLYESSNAVSFQNIVVTANEIKFNEAVIVSTSASKKNTLVTGSGTLSGNSIVLDLTSQDTGKSPQTQKFILIKE